MDSSKKLGILILAGGSSRDKLPGFPVFRASPAFLPINSRALGKFVLDFYLEMPCEIYMALNTEDFAAAKEEFASYGSRIKLLNVGHTKSVVETLERALEFTPNSELILNLVTSLPKTSPTREHSVVVDVKEQLAEDWSALALENGRVRFIKKNQATADIGYAFSGILRASRSDLLTAVGAVPTLARTDLLEVVERLHALKPLHIEHADWHDCGHIQNYFKTRQKIFGSRYFNKISLSEDLTVLTKTSSNTRKLAREAAYVEALPQSASLLFPRIVSYTEEPSVARLAIEFYGYPTLAEVMLYWNLPGSLWQGVFQRLGEILTQFRKSAGQLPSSAWSEVYVDKVRERVKAYREQMTAGESEDLFAPSGLRLNGTALMSWREVSDLLPALLKTIQKADDVSLIHGDFCFNNILCEPYGGLIKLLDPRGSFGESAVGIFGDHKYDWAKLGHSVVGRYDYIVNDLFQVSGVAGSYDLTVFDRPWQAELDSLFWSISESSGIEPRTLQIIMGTLFVSMTSLHQDNPKRQLAFFLTGMRFFTQALRDEA